MGNLNPALREKLYLDAAKKLDEELKSTLLTHEEDDCMVTVSCYPTVVSLGFRLDNGDYLTENECQRLVDVISSAIDEACSIRYDKASKLADKWRKQ